MLRIVRIACSAPTLPPDPVPGISNFELPLGAGVAAAAATARIEASVAPKSVSGPFITSRSLKCRDRAFAATYIDVRGFDGLAAIRSHLRPVRRRAGGWCSREARASLSHVGHACAAVASGQSV